MTKPIVTNPPFTPSSPKRTPTAPKAPARPHYEVVDVTPELAEKWLNQNTHNRNVKTGKVYAYARDMEAGKWTENGEAIKFAADGTLLDGQHRLMAIGLAGVTLPILVVTGLAKTTQETMDDGSKRTLADALTLRGEKSTSVLGGVIRRALLWDMGITNPKSSYSPTNSECLAFLDSHPKLRESTAIAVSLRKPTMITGSALGLAHWVFNAIDAADAEWFFEHLRTGAGLEQYHPILTLRKRFAEEWSAQTSLPEELTIVFLIKGWNAFRAGEEMRILRYKPGGASPEKFPQPK